MYRVRLVLVLLVLVSTTLTGPPDAFNTMQVAHTLLQKLAVSTQVAYVVFGALAIPAILAKHRAAKWALIAWAISTTATAALATYVWGEAGLGTTLASGVGAAGLGALVVWGGIASART
jgi:hypothetical protein